MKRLVRPSQLVQDVLCLGEKTPFSIKEFPYLNAIYDTNARELGLFTARQVAKSTFLASKMLVNVPFLKDGRQILVSPLMDQSTEFSVQRLRPFIEHSPVIKAMMSGEHKIDQVLRKGFCNRHVIALGYAQRTADRLRGQSIKDNGVLGFDESVVAGTLVQTPTGQTKIEDLKVGDDVLSHVRALNSVVIDRIVKVYDHGKRLVWKLSFEGGHSLSATSGSRLQTVDGWAYVHQIIDASLGPIDPTDATGDAAGGFGDQPDSQASPDLATARAAAEDVLLAQGGPAAPIRGDAAEDNTERGVRGSLGCVQNEDLAGLRFLVRTNHATEEGPCGSHCNPGTARPAHVGGRGLLVHGRRFDLMDEWSAYRDARFFSTRERSSGLVVVLERDRDFSVPDELRARVELLSTDEPHIIPFARRPDRPLGASIAGLQTRDSAGNRTTVQHLSAVVRARAEPAPIQDRCVQRDVLHAAHQAQQAESCPAEGGYSRDLGAAGSRNCAATRSGVATSSAPGSQERINPHPEIQYTEASTAAGNTPSMAGCESGEAGGPNCEDRRPGEGLSYRRLVSVELVGWQSVYDIETAEHHNFFANDLCIHNCQDILPEVFPVVKEMAFRAKDVSYLYCGTPKSLSNHMEKFRSASTQNEWAVKCGHCNFWNMRWDEQNIGNAGIVCAKCKGAINTNSGQWVSTRRRDDAKGLEARVTKESYRIPQLIVKPIMDDPLKFRELLDKLRGYSQEKFYNEVLGLPYDSAAQPIRLDQLLACCDPNLRNKIPEVDDASRPHLVMGVDWAFLAENSFTYVTIGGWLNFPSKFKLYYAKIFRGIEADSEYQIKWILDTVQKYGIKMVCADWGAGHVQNLRLVRELGEERVAQVWHTAMKSKGAVGERARWHGKSRKWHLARTRVMTDTFESLRRGEIILPRAEEIDHLLDHTMSIQMELRPETNIPFYNNLTPDDGFHSLTFCMLGAELLLRGDFSGHGGTQSVNEAEAMAFQGLDPQDPEYAQALMDMGIYGG